MIATGLRRHDVAHLMVHGGAAEDLDDAAARLDLSSPPGDDEPATPVDAALDPSTPAVVVDSSPVTPRAAPRLFAEVDDEPAVARDASSPAVARDASSPAVARDASSPAAAPATPAPATPPRPSSSVQASPQTVSIAVGDVLGMLDEPRAGPGGARARHGLPAAPEADARPREAVDQRWVGVRALTACGAALLDAAAGRGSLGVAFFRWLAASRKAAAAATLAGAAGDAADARRNLARRLAATTLAGGFHAWRAAAAAATLAASASLRAGADRPATSSFAKASAARLFDAFAAGARRRTLATRLRRWRAAAADVAASAAKPRARGGRRAARL
ncbi:hypothetical protein JL720_592 [Aureococcus anophagefferens]|nr:hypothetical protein JL720_592 [Aureococcus anophagefferens]